MTNIYVAPDAQWPDSVINTSNKYVTTSCCLCRWRKSHDRDWAYNTADENGELLVAWSSTGLQLIHDVKDRCTFYSRIHQSQSNPDLCVDSVRTEGFLLFASRRVLPSYLLYPSIPRPLWHFNKADLPPIGLPPLSKNYFRFTRLVINTTKKCIHRWYRKEYIPCWSERLYEEFKDSEDPEVAKELLKSLDGARKGNG